MKHEVIEKRVLVISGDCNCSQVRALQDGGFTVDVVPSRTDAAVKLASGCYGTVIYISTDGQDALQLHADMELSLQEAVQNLTAANEELAASNEELAAANEELRITTEELNKEVEERRRAEEEVRSMALFPDENPNPVMRVSASGEPLYSNSASTPLLEYWANDSDSCLPNFLITAAIDAMDSGAVREIDLSCNDRIFSFILAPITNQGYVNLYGRDITERRHAEEALHELEAHKKEFYQRTILAATEGKLIITEKLNIDKRVCDPIRSWHISDNDSFGKMRDEVSQLALAAGMDQSTTYQFLGCVVEAAGNAIKHANGGEASLCRTEDSLIFVISDTGPGIGALAIPDVALTRHYSTAGTLGMGYKLMIKFADRVYLCTGSEGTTVAIEMTLQQATSASASPK